jgi:hypothetical protein
VAFLVTVAYSQPTCLKPIPIEVGTVSTGMGKAMDTGLRMAFHTHGSLSISLKFYVHRILSDYPTTH